MECSFGTLNEHYGQRRIKVRTRLTEILYIFFGIHTVNVVQLVWREALKYKDRKTDDSY